MTESSAQRRQTWQKRRDANLCIRCGEVNDRLPLSTCSECLVVHSDRNKQYMRGIKTKVFNHYGNKCACCGETIIQFLGIDHINGNGNKHRREFNISGGYAIYRFLIKNNYPEGFRLLCHNCNVGRSINGGTCPHVK